MTIPSSPEIGRTPSVASTPLWVLLTAQLSFGIAWSTFLVQPKFLAQALGAGPSQIGFASAIGPLAGAACIPVGAALIDRLGRKPLLVGGACLTLVASVGFLTVDHLGPTVYLLQAFVGASFAFAFNSIIALATDGAPPERLARVIGYIAAANMVTNAIGTVTAETLAASAGWPSVFVFAALASLGALAVASRISEPSSARALLRSGPSDTARLRGPLGRVVLAAMLMGSAFIALFTFVQPLALELGATSVSPFYVAFTASAVLVRVGLGGLGDRHGRARVSVAALGLYGAVTAAGVYLEPSLLPVFGAIFGLAHGVAYPTMNALAIEHAPAAARGRAITIFNGAFNLGASCGAFSWGLMAERWGYGAVFLPAGALGFAALAILNPLRVRPRTTTA